MPWEGEAVALVVLAAALVGSVHLFAAQLRQRLFRSEAVADSVFAGLSAAYVFLVLLPELDTTHDVLGDSVFLVVLAAFVTFYGIEHAAERRDRTSDTDAGRRGLFWLRTGLLWVTTLLFVLTLPDHLHDQTTFFILTVGGAALGLAVHSYDVFDAHPTLHQRVGRWVLATAAAVGAAVDLFLRPPPEVVLDVLIAVLAGAVLLKALVGSEWEHTRTRFLPFLSGTAVYALVFLTRPLHPG